MRACRGPFRFFAFYNAQRIHYTTIFEICKRFLKTFCKKSRFFVVLGRQKLRRCQSSRKDERNDSHKHLCGTGSEEQELCAAEGISEEGNAAGIAVAGCKEVCEDRAEHQRQEYRDIGYDRMEGEVVGAVRFRQMNVRQGRKDRAGRYAQNVLRKADGDIKPQRICGDKGIHEIGSRMDQYDNCQRAEPIELGDELFPHRREEDEEEEIRRVDAVAKRVADADVLKDVGIECGVGEVCREGVTGADQNGQQEFLFLEGKSENVGKLCFGNGCVGVFLRQKKDETVYDGECKCDKTNDRQHEKLVLGACHLIADRGNDEGDKEGDEAVDTARSIKIVYANMLGKEVCMPCGITGGKERVDGAIQNGQRYEAEDQHLGILNEHRQDRDTENADGVAAHSDGEKKPFTLGESFQNPRREDLEKTSEIRHEGQNTDLGFIESVL